MSLGRVLLSLLLPPLAVYDRGCGSIVIVAILTCFGWVPGVIGALVILNKNDATDTKAPLHARLSLYPGWESNPHSLRNASLSRRVYQFRHPGISIGGPQK